MKNKIIISSLISIFAITFFILTSINVTNAHAINTKQSYTGTIHKGGFFGLTQASESKTAIFYNRCMLDSHIDDMLNTIKQDSAITDAIFDNSKQQIMSTFACFDGNFFKKNNLVIALIDSGSGSIKYNINDITAQDCTLDIKIDKTVPPIQTMDYINWILTLKVDKSIEFNQVQINLNTVQTNNS